MSSGIEDFTAQRAEIGGSLKPKASGTGPGKLLIPLLVGLSVLALAVAGAAIWLQMQEREKRQAKERELVLVSAEREDLRHQVGKLQETASKMEEALNRAKEEMSAAQAQLVQVQESRDALTRSVEERDKELSRLKGDMQQLQAERTTLAAKIDQFSSQRDSFQQQLAELERQRDELEVKLHDASDRPTVQLDKIVVTSDENAAPAALAADQTSSVQAPATHSGQVIVVNRKYDFIVMNLGKSHGLSVGQEFQVFHGEKALGKVRVEKVYDELSAATILPESQKDSIKEGDTVRAL